MIITTKTKNIVLLALVSTFILSIVITQQQIFAQGLFQSQQSERNQSSLSSPPAATTVEEDDNSEVAKPATNDDDQKITLGNITIPINSKTQLSLEMPDSKITVEPNQ
jgi:hypothetical protein